MVMTVLGQLNKQTSDIYDTAAWRLVVETHLNWLRTQRESDVVVVPPYLAYKYEGDLYGALTELRIPTHMHWTIMRVNGLYTPNDFRGEEAITLYVPTRETFQELAQVALTTQKKIT